MTRKKLFRLFVYFANVLVSLAIAFPFLWLVINAFKTYDQIYSFPILYWPKQITFEHFAHILRLNFPLYFFNSIFIGIGTACLSILIAVLPAYASARFRFKGRKVMLISILICQMFPYIIFVLPFFILLKQFHLLDSYPGMIISYLPFTTPIAIWMIRSFFVQIPRELEDASLIDGCNRMQTFYKICLPLTVPGIAAVGIYALLSSWSELMFSLSFLTSKNMQTIPVFLSVFLGEYDTRWGPLFAASIISAIPPMLVFGFLQKYFIRGLMSGSVKE
jgi:multiple sugar transport system permease protein